LPIDNRLYDADGDIWWDETRPLSTLRTAINPGRVGYLQDVISRIGMEPSACDALEVGCGGGLMAEEVARLGFRLKGVDPSSPSIETARRHAVASGLEIEYSVAAGEKLPFSDDSFDLVYCCDVLEHVDELDAVIAEAARVLKPNGIYFYDTINRTLPAKLVMIKLFQEWSATSWMPPNLHDYDKFIKPAELRGCLARAGLQEQECVGLTPSALPPKLLFLLRKLKKGEISPAEMGRRTAFRRSRDKSMLYSGYAAAVNQ
jgi:2-polyprenyl-6-hydroxyphenyl methylase/3-demethylubiquinone-9 3-methyltransferase